MTIFQRSLPLFFCAVVLGLAQSSGTIQGVVTDSTGAVIPGASVVVRNLNTGVEFKSETNQTGFYAVPALNPGRYSITCTAPGFAGKECPTMQLEVQQTARLDCIYAPCVSVTVTGPTDICRLSHAPQMKTRPSPGRASKE